MTNQPVPDPAQYYTMMNPDPPRATLTPAQAKRRGRKQGWLALGAIVAVPLVLALLPDGIGLLVALAALYLVPAIVAYVRHAPLREPVAVVNLFLGWTLIGWVVALAMAVKR